MEAINSEKRRRKCEKENHRKANRVKLKIRADSDKEIRKIFASRSEPCLNTCENIQLCVKSASIEVL